MKRAPFRTRPSFAGNGSLFYAPWLPSFQISTGGASALHSSRSAVPMHGRLATPSSKCKLTSSSSDQWSFFLCGSYPFDATDSVTSLRTSLTDARLLTSWMDNVGYAPSLSAGLLWGFRLPLGDNRTTWDHVFTFGSLTTVLITDPGSRTMRQATNGSLTTSSGGLRVRSARSSWNILPGCSSAKIIVRNISFVDGMKPWRQTVGW